MMNTPGTDPRRDGESIAALEQTLHVIKMPDGFHVVQIPGEAGTMLTHWVGPQVNRAAAEMQRSELIQAATHGDLSGCFSGSAVEFFDVAGSVEEFIKRHEGDVRSLALALAREAPWDARAFTDDQAPF